jgi:hypothetical protein
MNATFFDKMIAKDAKKLDHRTRTPTFALSRCCLRQQRSFPAPSPFAIITRRTERSGRRMNCYLLESFEVNVTIALSEFFSPFSPSYL